MRRLAMMTALVLLVGCIPRHEWVKEDASAAEFRKDLDWCQSLAELETGYVEDQHDYLIPYVEIEVYDKCMRERGWRRPGEPPEAAKSKPSG